MEDELQLDVDLSDMSLEDLQEQFVNLGGTLDQDQTVQPETEVPTDTTPPPTERVQQPSTEGQTDEAWKIPERRYDEPGVGGFLKNTAIGLAEYAAPIVGIADTVIDTINFVKAGDQFDIPKIPEYESNATQALRNISGLVIPSLGL